jgi:hypothetical protein
MIALLLISGFTLFTQPVTFQTAETEQGAG